MERIYVAVRARPLSPEESKASPWRISGNSIYSHNQSTKFDFDRVFGEDCKTVDIFGARTKEIVASIVRGFNGTVFAYGQTSSGKTYTMRGSMKEPGIIPLSVHELFCGIQEEIDREFLVRMSYMEIYNEEINDLLAPEHRKLQIHESLERGIYVAGLKEEIVTSPEQVLELVEFGESHRHIGETNMNLYSSRSHTIFRMIVESRERNEEGDSNNCFDAVRVPALNLVDLAGSERAVKTGAEGMRLKEGSHINKSLLTLGTVIKKLSDGVESQGGHVPYRDSKLTRILQPALGGNANTAIICNITLSQIHADETKSSLLFSSRALQVKNCACVNEILTDAALLKRQKKEIEELRAKLPSSQSEHLEEEILNLRNTLLQSELEKERIALELEEEKKAKAYRERRLLEQAKKIENLSSLILFSERDDKATHSPKRKRRLTWCPGLFPQKLPDELPNMEADTMEAVEEEPEINLSNPFSELVQESEDPVDSIPFASSLSEISDYTDRIECFSLPDAHALLNVTSRRKKHQNRARLPLEGYQSDEQLSEFAELCFEDDAKMKVGDIKIEEMKISCPEMQSSSIKSYSPSLCYLTEAASQGQNNLTLRESEAILIIKHLQEQIKSLEIEKTLVQMNLDNVVSLATEQNASFREKHEELQQDARNAREEARTIQEQLRLLYNQWFAEINGDTTVNFSLLITEISSEFDLLRHASNNASAIFDECFQLFSILSDILESLKMLPRSCIVQLKSIISGRECLDSFMNKKYKEVELEKNLLSNQLCDHQKQIHELMSDLENREKIVTDQGLRHDMEKNELLSQVLGLQKELSQLSSSSLAREKETLRKELDKSKSKLKDTECKLKNTIQDKVKLEGEKAQGEREIKSLQGQRAILERDILKRDSLLDRRHESRSDLNKVRGLMSVAQQNLQNDYDKFEFIAFEMEAEISSLKEALEITIGEKEEVYVKNGILNSELEGVSNKLSTAYFEMELLKEELRTMEQRLVDSEFSSREFENSLNLLSKEKEEMILEFTDALLEVDVEKSEWALKAKSLSEKLNISNYEIVKLLDNLSEVRKELDLCKDQCNDVRAKLCLSDENTKITKNPSMIKPSDIGKLRDDFSGFNADTDRNEDTKYSLELVSPQSHPTCAEVCNLRSTGERDSLLSKVEQLKRLEVKLEILEGKYDDLQSSAELCFQELNQRILRFEVEIKELRDAYHHNHEDCIELRKKLSSTQAKLDTYRRRLKESLNEMKVMDTKYQEASTILKNQLRTYGQHILDLTKRLAEKE